MDEGYEMTPAEFFVKYQREMIDYDKAYGAQCVDVFRQYCRDVIGCPHTGAVDGAKDLWFRFIDNDEKKYFNRFNALQAKYGDVLIEDGTPSNKWGHVSIVVTPLPDKEHALVFQQNGLDQKGGELAIRNIKNALGVLRKKP